MKGTDEFLDARPQEEEGPLADEAEGGDDDVVFTDVREAGQAPAEAAAEPDDDGADMVFLDELEAPPGAPRPAPAPRPGPGPRPPSGPPAGASSARRPGSDPPRPAGGPSRRAGSSADAPALEPPGRKLGRPTSSAEAAALEPPSRTSSGRLRTLGPKSAPPSQSAGRGLRPALRPERTPEDDQQALAALEARAQPAPASDPFLGRDLGPFRVDRFIEQDRGERRYLAMHLEQRRQALLRVFPLTGPYGEEFKRLADRGERACRVEAQSLDAALASGRTKDAFYAGFDPPAGPTLAEVLASEGPLAEADVLAVIEQVGKALGALHAREGTHGHLSPAVIRRLRPGVFVLEAAGLARPRPALSFLAAGGDVLGSPGFVAPETVDGGDHTRASDLYGLGCVAWTLLAGRPPFQGDDEVQVLLDQLNQEVPRLAGALPAGAKVSEATLTIVDKLAGYTPDVRYRDLNDLLADLRAREKGEPIKPLAAARHDAARPRTKVQGAAVSIIVLAALNAVLLTIVALTVLKALSLPLNDPLEGVDLPLPEAAPPR
ncbi:MAG: hypothetical protein M9894_26575 [Planctomycetes bacterium]|nr:hypothetical protein [Planctomycetota bacterium]